MVDGETLAFTLKTPWSNGTKWLLLRPEELGAGGRFEKLAALVPPPRQNLVRYHGVLAPASPDRAQIVPGPSELTAAAFTSIPRDRAIRYGLAAGKWTEHSDYPSAVVATADIQDHRYEVPLWSVRP